MPLYACTMYNCRFGLQLPIIADFSFTFGESRSGGVYSSHFRFPYSFYVAGLDTRSIPLPFLGPTNGRWASPRGLMQAGGLRGRTPGINTRVQGDRCCTSHPRRQTTATRSSAIGTAVLHLRPTALAHCDRRRQCGRQLVWFSEAPGFLPAGASGARNDLRVRHCWRTAHPPP